MNIVLVASANRSLSNNQGYLNADLLMVQYRVDIPQLGLRTSR